MLCTTMVYQILFVLYDQWNTSSLSDIDATVLGILEVRVIRMLDSGLILGCDNLLSLSIVVVA